MKQKYGWYQTCRWGSRNMRMWKTGLWCCWLHGGVVPRRSQDKYIERGAMWTQLYCALCGIPMVCSTEGVRLGSEPCCAEPCPEGGTKRPLCPQKFRVQNRQGRKGSSGREKRGGLSMVSRRAGSTVSISWLMLQSQPLSSTALKRSWQGSSG